MTVRFKIRADTVHIPGVGVLTKTGEGYWSDWITTDAPAELLKPFEHADPDSPDRARMPGKVAYVHEPVFHREVVALHIDGTAELRDMDGPPAPRPFEPLSAFDEDTPAVAAQPKKRSKR